MQKVFVSRDFIEKIIFGFNSYTIENFKENTEIDIDSYLFFKKIIESEAQVFTDIDESEIEKFYLGDSEISIEDKNLSVFISTRGNNRIKSCKLIFDKIKNQDYSGLQQSDLPCYILMGNVPSEICLRIENDLGINCFSLKRLKVPIFYRTVSVKHLKNTHDDLFNSLNEFPHLSLEIFDPYFWDNSSRDTKCMKNRTFLSGLKKNKLNFFELVVNADYVSYNHKKPNNILFDTEKIKNIFKTKINEYNSESTFKINIVMTLKATHDRSLISNTFFAFLGHSLNIDKKTTISIFPKIIYHNFRF